MASSSATEKMKVVELEWGHENNFLEWKKFILGRTEREFGFLSNVIKNDRPYVPPAVQVEDYTPGVIDGQDNLSEKSVLSLRYDAEKMRMKEVNQLKLDMPKFYAAIIETLSVASLQQIQQHEDFEAADLARDANKLWVIIEKTHYLYQQL